jgi:hypothetical protein
MRGSHKTQILGVALLGLAILLPACTHDRVVQVGTHKVTIMRHGFEKHIPFNADAKVPTFQYKGVSTAGAHLNVMIKGDKVTVNDADYGNLRPGDSVLIGDEGVAVNSLDYGESEKYLRANSSNSQLAAQN